MGELDLHPAAFTVDLEEWYHAELVRRHASAGELESRAGAATAPILDLLDRHGVRATFFVVGDLLRGSPELIGRLVKSGHEIGCHTFTHRTLWDMSPEDFRNELREFKAALAEVAPGVAVRGFRAPTFSVDRRTAWMFRVLEEEGFTYDSSVVPARGPLYGCPGAPPGIYRPSREDFLRDDPHGPLVEFPAPVVTFAGGRLPVAGGFYLRMLPFALYRRLVRGVLRKRAFFLYIHPWETDAGTPRLPLPRLARWATYRGMAGMLRKVERLLREIPFTTMREAIEAAGFRV